MCSNFRDKIYKKCKEMGRGQKFGFLKYDQFVRNPNYIPRILDNIEDINGLYKLLLQSDLYTITRTPTGTIAKHDIHHASGAWDIRKVYTDSDGLKGIILTVILRGEVFVFKFGNFKTKDSDMTGSRAFRIFNKACKKHSIDINKYKISNGKSVKDEIESPYIRMFVKYKKIQRVNHLDINSAWSAGVCKDYPEFTSVMQELRSKDKIIGNMALGYCQSKYIDYTLSQLSKSGVNNCNRQLDGLIKKLIEQGFQIIGLNTDGIWYKDATGKNRLYHDENEGHDLGQWKNDHIDCEFMAYSDGQYWFKENGQFNVRARGYYSYEQLKPREDWDETDFDKAMGTQTILEWNDREGFIYNA